MNKSELDVLLSATAKAMSRYVGEKLLVARVETADQILGAVNLVRDELGLPRQKALGHKPRVRRPAGSAPYP